MSIKADALSDEIAKLLSEYETEIVKNADACGKVVANAAAKELRQTSPKRTGKYAKSWGVTREAGGFGENARYIVHNKKRYRLTHLLEHGHVTANGKRTIKPVEEQVIREYEKQVREAIEDAAK